jgi:hypothetical protein
VAHCTRECTNLSQSTVSQFSWTQLDVKASTATASARRNSDSRVFWLARSRILLPERMARPCKHGCTNLSQRTVSQSINWIRLDVVVSKAPASARRNGDSTVFAFWCGRSSVLFRAFVVRPCPRRECTAYMHVSTHNRHAYCTRNRPSSGYNLK